MSDRYNIDVRCVNAACGVGRNGTRIRPSSLLAKLSTAAEGLIEIKCQGCGTMNQIDLAFQGDTWTQR